MVQIVLDEVNSFHPGGITGIDSVSLTISDGKLMVLVCPDSVAEHAVHTSKLQFFDPTHWPFYRRRMNGTSLSEVRVGERPCLRSEVAQPGAPDQRFE